MIKETPPGALRSVSFIKRFRVHVLCCSVQSISIGLPHSETLRNAPIALDKNSLVKNMSSSIWRQIHVVRALGGHSGFPALGHIENIQNIYKYIQDIYKIPGGGGPARPRGYICIYFVYFRYAPKPETHYDHQVL